MYNSYFEGYCSSDSFPSPFLLPVYLAAKWHPFKMGSGGFYVGLFKIGRLLLRGPKQTCRPYPSGYLL